MLAYLNGKILKKTSKGIILKLENLGYFVNLTKNLLESLKEDQEIEFFIHQHIKEDHQELYGFKEFGDLEFFKQLLTINGIGPKVALEILSVPMDRMKTAIVNEDEAFICKIPGIGKKTAKRLILEMKDKVDIEASNISNMSLSESQNDAFEALQKLGYQRSHVQRLFKDLPENITEAEDIITYFIKNA